MGAFGTLVAFGSVKLMESFFKVVNLLQIGILSEPCVQCFSDEVVEFISIPQQKFSDRQSSFVASDPFSHAIDMRGEKPKDVEFIGDDFGVWKEVANETCERITEIHGNISNVFATTDMTKG